MEAKIKELEERIKSITLKIEELQSDKDLLIEKLVNLKISPLELGDHVLCEIPRGRVKKWCECVLEHEFDILYARPVKNDGKLDNKHFYICIIGNVGVEDLKERIRPLVKPLGEE